MAYILNVAVKRLISPRESVPLLFFLFSNSSMGKME